MWLKIGKIAFAVLTILGGGMEIFNGVKDIRDTISGTPEDAEQTEKSLVEEGSK